jgi:basic membrane protein A
VLGDGVDDPAVGEVAQANNLKWTGYDSDQGQFAPDAFLTATVFDWGPYYVQEVKAVLDGTWKSNFYYGTIADGMIGIAPYGKSVTQEAQDAINKRMGEIKDGSFNPFTGPLTKQDGSPGLAAGKTLPVYDVNNPDTPSKYNINWFVQGVIGSASG